MEGSRILHDTDPLIDEICYQNVGCDIHFHPSFFFFFSQELHFQCINENVYAHGHGFGTMIELLIGSDEASLLFERIRN